MLSMRVLDKSKANMLYNYVSERLYCQTRITNKWSKVSINQSINTPIQSLLEKRQK